MDRKEVAKAKFNTLLTPDQVEEMRLNPEGFLSSVPPAPEAELTDQMA